MVIGYDINCLAGTQYKPEPIKCILQKRTIVFLTTNAYANGLKQQPFIHIYTYICVCVFTLYLHVAFIYQQRTKHRVRQSSNYQNMCIFPWLPNIYLVDSEWILSENNNSAYISEKGSFNYYSKYRAHVFNWKTCYVDYINTFFRSVIFLVVIATIKILKTTFH